MCVYVGGVVDVVECGLFLESRCIWRPGYVVKVRPDPGMSLKYVPTLGMSLNNALG